jgi:ribosomal protein L11 methylase PrmA
MSVVNEVLRLANVQSDDVIYDLGSGDGRIVISTAQQYGTRGIGIDIDPQRIQEANENAQKAEVSDRVQFLQQDLFEADFRNATVVTLYLLPELNVKLRPKLLRELKPGTRIVSHAFDMGEWEADETVEVDGKTVYYWVVPENPPANLL